MLVVRATSIRPSLFILHSFLHITKQPPYTGLAWGTNGHLAFFLKQMTQKQCVLPSHSEGHRDTDTRDRCLLRRRSQCPVSPSKPDPGGQRRGRYHHTSLSTPWDLGVKSLDQDWPSVKSPKK